MPTETAVASSARTQDPRPLVLHVMHRFDTGGLENGVVNLINHMPADAYRHAVVALTEVTAFSQRIRRPDVELVALHKAPGQGLRLLPSFIALLRRLRPAIVHTRNLAALEMQLAAWMAGVPVRVHGEHGRNVDDLHGLSRKQKLIRRAFRPLVHQQIAVSQDLAAYLCDSVGVSPTLVRCICNGVDTERFAPAVRADFAPSGWPFDETRHVVVGTVGRMQAVKHQTLLARAFVAALRDRPALRGTLRLAMAGDGPLRAECQALLAAEGMADLAWLPGERTDVPALMRSFSVFVLPSLAEGISNTILEAMASGVPVIATDVGGNRELVEQGRTGLIVPSDDVQALSAAIFALADQPERLRAMGAAARAAALERFSLAAMVRGYQDVYETQLRRAGWRREGA